MTSKFLSNVGSNANLTNGSADLYINSLGIAGLVQTGKPLTLSASKHIQAGNISQDSVTNLQNDLSIKNELSYTKSDAARTNPPAGQVKTYFKTDGEFYKLDEIGNETKVGGGDVNSDVSSSAVNQIATFNSTNGKTIKNSTVTIDASNNCVGMNNLTVGGLTDTQTLNVNGVINAGNNINNFGLITSQGYRMQLDNAVDIGETTKQVKDLYMKGDIKFNNPTQNILLGINAGGSITTGNNNTAIGQSSLENLSSGIDNVCIGQSSGTVLTTANNNTAVGRRSLYTATTGGLNTCVGLQAGAAIISGNNNTCIGSLSNASASASNQISLGFDAVNDTDNSCVIGNILLANIRPSTNRVCDLGTTTQNFKDIHGDKVILNTQAQSNRYYNNNGNAGIDIANTTAGNVTLTGSSYSGVVNRIMKVNGAGQIELSNATIDNTGNFTASNTTLDSLTLKNNLNFDLDNSHDLGTSLTSARNIYYKTNLSGNTATFTGTLNSSTIVPITDNTVDLGSTGNRYRNLYVGGSIFQNGTPINTPNAYRFLGTTSFTIYEDADVRFTWDGVNKQPRFLVKVITGWWDAGITKFYNGTIINNADDIASINTINNVDYYFTTSGGLNTSYNMVSYATRLECHLCHETNSNTPFYLLTFICGNDSTIYATIQRFF